MAGGKGKIEPVDGKPFVKNDSRINRAGRPKKLPELNDLLVSVFGNQDVFISILSALKKKAQAGDVRAGELCLDRCYGKLKQSNEINIEFDNLTESQLDELINRILKTPKQ
jgi:hypothetical protein